MRTTLTHPPADHIVLVGTGATAMAALWRLCAAGAHIRWYADSADVGEEAILAHALAGGRIELSFDDPLTAPLEGATAIVIADGETRHVRLAERARASGLVVHFGGEIALSGPAPAQLTSLPRVEAAAAIAPA
jgi:siroheme synthase (precorrin-2 oxidase/ferrochelatase)